MRAASKDRSTPAWLQRLSVAALCLFLLGWATVEIPTRVSVHGQTLGAARSAATLAIATILWLLSPRAPRWLVIAAGGFTALVLTELARVLGHPAETYGRQNATVYLLAVAVTLLTARTMRQDSARRPVLITAAIAL